MRERLLLTYRVDSDTGHQNPYADQDKLQKTLDPDPSEQDSDEHDGADEYCRGHRADHYSHARQEYRDVDVHELLDDLFAEEWVFSGEKVSYQELVVLERGHGPCQVHDHCDLDYLEDMDLQASDADDSPGLIDVQRLQRSYGLVAGKDCQKTDRNRESQL